MSTPAQFMRRCEKIFSGLLYRRKDQYAGNRFGNEPGGETLLENRIRQLEQLVDRLTLENGFLFNSRSAGTFIREGKSWFITKHRHLLETPERG